MQMLFRCIELRDKFLLFEDVDILSPEFPEYIKMMQIGGLENYELHMATGLQCSITGTNLYEKDIVKASGSIYKIIYSAPGFELELLSGPGDDTIFEDDIEKLGSSHENVNILE